MPRLHYCMLLLHCVPLEVVMVVSGHHGVRCTPHYEYSYYCHLLLKHIYYCHLLLKHTNTQFSTDVTTACTQTSEVLVLVV